ncbi:CopG family transcriptional regulator [Novosphingobium sp. KACC 22771]|uniref:CopG family transcriptional regulator n=1 Tax=Novosphingobium sp. KACC 22771 TaxID=3025670 RepID=UPI00236549DD|nr:CopG family transcriptional regulator [Novosphingobium sp. KACC 22771]WDF75235.1 CopG family transcriptional regulator [Novosphingobium sp. KACC 22771]
MPKINFRLDGSLHTVLMRRARGANLSMSSLIRHLLEQAVDERRRYVFSSQDEILATSIQILSILATSVGQQSPKALEQGMAQARTILAERGLLGGEDGQ